MCFWDLIGCLKPTTDLEQRPKINVLICEGEKIGHVKVCEDVHTADFDPLKSKHDSMKCLAYLRGGESDAYCTFYNKNILFSSLTNWS